MITQKETFYWHMLNRNLRLLLRHFGTKFFPLYVVNEYPKSGGSWVGEMLSDALKVPFPRNRLPVFKSSILQGHTLKSWNMHNVVIVWRDGRDLLVSQYYYWLFKNERFNSRLVDRSRGDLQFTDYQDIKNNLPIFMKYIFDDKRSIDISWTDFVNKWADCERCVHVKYEDLRTQPFVELSRIVNELTGKTLEDDEIQNIIDAHSFERKSKRKPGDENIHSFMRKGIIGDWKNHFTSKSRKLFDDYAGNALISLGYEEDHSWVQGESSVKSDILG